MSSPRRLSSFSLRRALPRAYLFTTLVRAFLKPSSCMPPSLVVMPLAKEWRPSVVARVPLERELDLLVALGLTRSSRPS